MNVITVALAMLETAFGCPKIFHEWPFSVPRSSPGSHTACSHHVSYSSLSDDRFVFFPCLAWPFWGGLVRYFSVERPSFWSVCWFLTVRLGFGDVGKHMTRGEGLHILARICVDCSLWCFELGCMAEMLSLFFFPDHFPSSSFYVESSFRSRIWSESTLSLTCSDSTRAVPTLTCEAFHGGAIFLLPSSDPSTVSSCPSPALASCSWVSASPSGSSYWCVSPGSAVLPPRSPYFSSLVHTASFIHMKVLPNMALLCLPFLEP